MSIKLDLLLTKVIKVFYCVTRNCADIRRPTQLFAVLVFDTKYGADHFNDWSDQKYTDQFYWIILLRHFSSDSHVPVSNIRP